jgi:hypothetical protein
MCICMCISICVCMCMCMCIYLSHLHYPVSVSRYYNVPSVVDLQVVYGVRMSVERLHTQAGASYVSCIKYIGVV